MQWLRLRERLHLAQEVLPLEPQEERRAGRVHVNPAFREAEAPVVESFNGTGAFGCAETPIMRRAVVGVWHQISVKHLGRYASEATFRWNRKKEGVLARMEAMVRNGEGRLLRYRLLVGKEAQAA